MNEDPNKVYDEDSSKSETAIGACCCFSVAVLIGIAAIFLGTLIIHGISALVRTI